MAGLMEQLKTITDVNEILAMMRARDQSDSRYRTGRLCQTA